MRQRDQNHEDSLKKLVTLNADEGIRRIGINDYRNPEYVASEVLASIVRARFGAGTGVLTAATMALHHRVVEGAEIRAWSHSVWRDIARNNSEAIKDAIGYFWAKFVADKQAVCNAEVRFGVYLENKVDDYMRHLLTEENTRESIDAISVTDDDGEDANYIDIVKDLNGESPEEAAIRGQMSKVIAQAFLVLSERERQALYLRVECDYDWNTVAKDLACSIPTARNFVKTGLEKLRGEIT